MSSNITLSVSEYDEHSVKVSWAMASGYTLLDLSLFVSNGEAPGTSSYLEYLQVNLKIGSDSTNRALPAKTSTGTEIPVADRRYVIISTLNGGIPLVAGQVYTYSADAYISNSSNQLSYVSPNAVDYAIPLDPGTPRISGETRTSPTAILFTVNLPSTNGGSALNQILYVINNVTAKTRALGSTALTATDLRSGSATVSLSNLISTASYTIYARVVNAAGYTSAPSNVVSVGIFGAPVINSFVQTAFTPTTPTGSGTTYSSTLFSFVVAAAVGKDGGIPSTATLQKQTSTGWENIGNSVTLSDQYIATLSYSVSNTTQSSVNSDIAAYIVTSPVPQFRAVVSTSSGASVNSEAISGICFSAIPNNEPASLSVTIPSTASATLSQRTVNFSYMNPPYTSTLFTLAVAGKVVESLDIVTTNTNSFSYTLNGIWNASQIAQLVYTQRLVMPAGITTVPAGLLALYPGSTSVTLNDDKAYLVIPRAPVLLTVPDAPLAPLFAIFNTNELNNGTYKVHVRACISAESVVPTCMKVEVHDNQTFGTAVATYTVTGNALTVIDEIAYSILENITSPSFSWTAGKPYYFKVSFGTGTGTVTYGSALTIKDAFYVGTPAPDVEGPSLTAVGSEKMGYSLIVKCTCPKKDSSELYSFTQLNVYDSESKVLLKTLIPSDAISNPLLPTSYGFKTTFPVNMPNGEKGAVLLQSVYSNSSGATRVSKPTMLPYFIVEKSQMSYVKTYQALNTTWHSVWRIDNFSDSVTDALVYTLPPLDSTVNFSNAKTVLVDTTTTANVSSNVTVKQISPRVTEYDITYASAPALLDSNVCAFGLCSNATGMGFTESPGFKLLLNLEDTRNK
jgi:hypothetical protein